MNVRSGMEKKKGATISLPAKRHLNGVLLAGRRWPYIMLAGNGLT